MDAGDAPVFSVHDDGDNIVPYGQGYGTFVNRPISYLEGSQVITDTAIALGIPNQLITIPNSTGHVSYVNDTLWQDSIFTSSLVFLEEIICPTVVAVPATPTTNPAVVLFPNPARQQFQLQVEGALEETYYAIYNGVGQCVTRGQIYHQQLTIDCQKWPPGYYRVAVWEKNKPLIQATWKSLIIQ